MMVGRFDDAYIIFPDIADPDGTAAPPEDKAGDENKGQTPDDGAPTVVPVGGGAVTCQPPVETLASESGRQVFLERRDRRDMTDGDTEDASPLRQRSGHTSVEY